MIYSLDVSKMRADPTGTAVDCIKMVCAAMSNGDVCESSKETLLGCVRWCFSICDWAVRAAEVDEAQREDPPEDVQELVIAVFTALKARDELMPTGMVH